MSYDSDIEDRFHVEFIDGSIYIIEGDAGLTRRQRMRIKFKKFGYKLRMCFTETKCT